MCVIKISVVSVELEYYTSFDLISSILFVRAEFHRYIKIVEYLEEKNTQILWCKKIESFKIEFVYNVGIKIYNW